MPATEMPAAESHEPYPLEPTRTDFVAFVRALIHPMDNTDKIISALDGLRSGKLLGTTLAPLNEYTTAVIDYRAFLKKLEEVYCYARKGTPEHEGRGGPHAAGGSEDAPAPRRLDEVKAEEKQRNRLSFGQLDYNPEPFTVDPEKTIELDYPACVRLFRKSIQYRSEIERSYSLLSQALEKVPRSHPRHTNIGTLRGNILASHKNAESQTNIMNDALSLLCPLARKLRSYAHTEGTLVESERLKEPWKVFRLRMMEDFHISERGPKARAEQMVAAEGDKKQFVLYREGGQPMVCGYHISGKFRSVPIVTKLPADKSAVTPADESDTDIPKVAQQIIKEVIPKLGYDFEKTLRTLLFDIRNASIEFETTLATCYRNSSTVTSLFAKYHRLIEAPEDLKLTELHEANLKDGASREEHAAALRDYSIYRAQIQKAYGIEPFEKPNWPRDGDSGELIKERWLHLLLEPSKSGSGTVYDSEMKAGFERKIRRASDFNTASWTVGAFSKRALDRDVLAHYAQELSANFLAPLVKGDQTQLAITINEFCSKEELQYAMCLDKLTYLFGQIEGMLGVLAKLEFVRLALGDTFTAERTLKEMYIDGVDAAAVGVKECRTYLAEWGLKILYDEGTTQFESWSRDGLIGSMLIMKMKDGKWRAHWKQDAQKIIASKVNLDTLEACSSLNTLTAQTTERPYTSRHTTFEKLRQNGVTLFGDEFTDNWKAPLDEDKHARILAALDQLQKALPPLPGNRPPEYQGAIDNLAELIVAPTISRPPPPPSPLIGRTESGFTSPSPAHTDQPLDRLMSAAKSAPVTRSPTPGLLSPGSAQYAVPLQRQPGGDQRFFSEAAPKWLTVHLLVSDSSPTVSQLTDAKKPHPALISVNEGLSFSLFLRKSRREYVVTSFPHKNLCSKLDFKKGEPVKVQQGDELYNIIYSMLGSPSRNRPKGRDRSISAGGADDQTSRAKQAMSRARTTSMMPLRDGGGGPPSHP